MSLYLRCFTSEHPTKWVDWLSWAEYCYNTSYHSSLQTTPFEVVYGRPPPQLRRYTPGASNVDAVDKALQTRDAALEVIRQHLLQAQNRMKLSYDKHHRHLEFKVGDQVLLRLQPYRQISLAHRRNQKLAARFFGPFKVLKRIGPLAYELKLPPESRIHPVFHVSLLKPYTEGEDSQNSITPSLPLDPLISSPLAILDTRVHQGRSQVLVHWQHTSPADATWEDYHHIRAKYPDLALEDKCLFEGGSNVMDANKIFKYKRYTHGKYKKEAKEKEVKTDGS